MYVYYQTRRPIDIGTFPSNAKVVEVENFEEKKYCPEIEGEAWGRFTTTEPIIDEDVEAYELTSADAITWFGVLTVIYDDGRTLARIVNTEKSVREPEGSLRSCRDKDIYTDWFKSREDAESYIRETETA